jgi:hypothetical protein
MCLVWLRKWPQNGQQTLKEYKFRLNIAYLRSVVTTGTFNWTNITSTFQTHGRTFTLAAGVGSKKLFIKNGKLNFTGTFVHEYKLNAEIGKRHWCMT